MFMFYLLRLFLSVFLTYETEFVLFLAVLDVGWLVVLGLTAL